MVLVRILLTLCYGALVLAAFLALWRFRVFNDGLGEYIETMVKVLLTLVLLVALIFGVLLGISWAFTP